MGVVGQSFDAAHETARDKKNVRLASIDSSEVQW
jgi:hypothetical protein